MPESWKKRHALSASLQIHKRCAKLTTTLAAKLQADITLPVGHTQRVMPAFRSQKGTWWFFCTSAAAQVTKDLNKAHTQPVNPTTAQQLQ
jgi:hypothetical protein